MAVTAILGACVGAVLARYGVWMVEHSPRGGGEGGGTKSKGGLFVEHSLWGWFRVRPGAVDPVPQGRVVEGLGK